MSNCRPIPFLLCILLAVAGAGSVAYPAGSPSPLAAVSTGGDPLEQQGGPSMAATSDWSPPSGAQFGGAPQQETDQVKTDGSAALPSIEWRPSADSSETDAAADANLAPRVDIAGPGTPKWKVITFVSQKTTMDDNLYITHSNKQSDVSFSIAPGFAAGWGDFRSVLLARSSQFSDEYGKTREPVSEPSDGDFAYIDYTATATHYISHDSLDAVDQDGSFSGQWDFTRILTGLNARVQTLAGPDIDVGSRTRRTVFTIDSTANYAISDKTTLDLEAGGSYADYVSQLSSGDVHIQIGTNYQAFPKTSIGAALVSGIRTLESTPDQYYEQVLFNLNYAATSRLALHLSGGLEADDAAGSSTLVNPIFSLGATWTIDEDNSVTLSADRSTETSAVTAGETIESTGLDLEIRHRLYDSFILACSFSYDHGDYYSQGLSNVVRSDDYIFIRPSIAYNFAQWSQVELSYEYRRNLSTIQTFDFGENLASLQFNFVF